MFSGLRSQWMMRCFFRQRSDACARHAAAVYEWLARHGPSWLSAPHMDTKKA
jgi:hypothetical protein